MKKIMLRPLWITVLSCLFFNLYAKEERIDLQGSWKFEIDNEDRGVVEKRFQTTDWNDQIQLPGSMPENLKGNIPGLKTQWTGSLYDSSFYYLPEWEKYRQEPNVKFPFFLTPDRHYVGVAWYEREIQIPSEWKSQRITLYLERPHIETNVWIDGRYAGKDSSLCVPHIFDVSSLMTPGKHRLTIRVDNRLKEVNVGQDSHSVTDQTQGNWNGMVGELFLEASSKSYVEDVQVYPNLNQQLAALKIHIGNAEKKAIKGQIVLSAESFNSEQHHSTPKVSQEVLLPVGGMDIDMTLPFGEGMLTWDEFDPALYRMTVQWIVGGKICHEKQLSFGMREISIEGRWIYINGRKTLMRGTVENCCFPATGYAPMDVASWERVFRKCKEYGLNHVRFHSFCPPQAAFAAADLVGIYLQPEGPSWPNHGSSLGNGKPIDQYLMDETIRMSKVYGNYASFCMLACGNEPRGRWVKWVSDFVDYWKATDSRRIYTGASVGGSWDWQPKSQYHVKAGARGLNWNNVQPESYSDFREQITRMKGNEIKEPFISHETGQWCVFPNFDEIKKYTGVNKARNFELFQENLADHDMASLGHDFMMASGKLQWLCYKHEIEKTLRTPDYAGFQLLALNDYSGQGSALVGVLDVFWEEKGYGTAAEFRRFCAPTVPLIRTEKFVYHSSDTLKAAVEIAHFGKQPLNQVVPYWTWKDAHGKICREGKLPLIKEIPIGNGIRLGDIVLDLSSIEQAGKYTLEVGLPCSEAINSWDFYVYPSIELPEAPTVMVENTLTDEVKQYLNQGGDVLLLAAGKIEYGKDVVQYFTPVFWNTSWFKMRPPHTTGILVNPHHPIFKDFPTDYYADFQWWELINKAQVMQLTDFPQGFQPLVQSIDTWFISRKIGMLIEAQVGKGRLVVCSADLSNNLENRPAAKQLYSSILNYMNSIYFRPEYQVDMQQIDDLFHKESVVFDTHTKAHPDELKPKPQVGNLMLNTAWPSIRKENKPGTRWWWLGSAVDKDNLTWNMEALSRAGIGSVEITPIYGVQGEEAREIQYLSLPWMEMLKHVQTQARRLDMEVDMNGGTGWPFGGPTIDTEHAASRQIIQTYPIKALSINAASAQVKNARKASGNSYQTQSFPIEVKDPKQKDVARLTALLFVHENGLRERLPLQAVEENVLHFAPTSDGTLYALFVGKTKQKVKRSAPGGEGLVMNHLSQEALTHYLQRFDTAFAKSGVAWPHAFFNDSYEVYGADWSENLPAEFKARRGYDIFDYLPEFMGEGDPQVVAKLVCDYRQTLAEMLMDNFTLPWTKWAHSHGVSTRNQAHGSPGNLLDLYAAVDVPECESFGCTQFELPYLRVDSGIRRNDANPATLKFASSAAHVSGKVFTSSESMTWLTEHFRTSLALIKPEMDQLFVNGINRVYYHGSPYTPKDAPWPGWLFYASILVNPNNTIFRDMDALNTYITRIQSFLQQGTPDNELLLYFPIYDIWENYRKGNYVAFDIHKLGEKLPRFEGVVNDMLAAGYDFDYISDAQLLQTSCQQAQLKTQGGSLYKAILVPDCEVIPTETMQQLLRLAQQGATILFLDKLPSQVPGLFRASERKKSLDSMLMDTKLITAWQGNSVEAKSSSDKISEVPYGKGRMCLSPQLTALLSASGLTVESIKSQHQADFIRRKTLDGTIYFVSMLKDASIDEWVTLGRKATSAMLFNPLNGEKGQARIRQQNGKTQLYLSLKAGESLLIKTFEEDEIKEPYYPIYQSMTMPKSYLKKHPNADGLELTGAWSFRFTEGDPAIEGVYEMPGSPYSWTNVSAEQAKNYAGTGVYSLSFTLPEIEAADWQLDFSNALYESARVRINGQEAGCVWCTPYQLSVGRYLKKGKNTIEIAVTNLPANRIADYDRRGEKWRIFKDINIVSVFYKPITFDVWNTVPSGLTAAPSLIPLKEVTR